MEPSADHLRKNAPVYAPMRMTANIQQITLTKRGERTRRLSNQSSGGARNVKAMKASCREDIPDQHPLIPSQHTTSNPESLVSFSLRRNAGFFYARMPLTTLPKTSVRR